MKKFIAVILLFVCSAAAFAQSAATPIMDDEMRSSGKIYVVIGTIAIVFIGITIYLFAIDRRLKKIEKENKD